MRVVIIGCGYVGLRAGTLLVDHGHEVVGVRRSAEGLEAVRAAGLNAHSADITDPADRRTLPDADWLIYTASAGRGDEQTARDVYVDGLAGTIEDYVVRNDPPARVVYTSSTGVYGEHGGGWVDESTEPRPAGARGELLLEAERVALDRTAESGIDGTVLRLGGIYGPGRYGLDRYLERPVVAGYRNTIHRHDAAGAIAHVLEGDTARDEVVLVVDGEPVDRWAFARWLAEAVGAEVPPRVTIDHWLSESDRSPVARERLRSNKRCRNDRLAAIGYQLEVQSVWEGYQPAIEAANAGRSLSR